MKTFATFLSTAVCSAIAAEPLHWWNPERFPLYPSDRLVFSASLDSPLPPGQAVVFALWPVEGSVEGLRMEVTASGVASSTYTAHPFVSRLSAEELSAYPAHFNITVSRDAAAYGAAQFVLGSYLSGSGETAFSSGVYDTLWEGQWFAAAGTSPPYRASFKLPPGSTDRAQYHLTVVPFSTRWESGGEGQGMVYVGDDHRVGPNDEDHLAKGWGDVVFEAVPGDVVYILAETQGSLDQVCSWQETSGVDHHYKCGDGYVCNTGEQGTCCVNHSGVANCPPQLPQMCASPTGCADGSQHCCSESVSGCQSHGGPRACVGTFQFRVSQSGVIPPPPLSPTPQPPPGDEPKEDGGGISGSVLFIILVLGGFGVYFSIGAANKWADGERECPGLLPHTQFWLDELPSLVIEGFRFLKSKVGRSSQQKTGGYRPAPREDFGAGEEEMGIGAAFRGEGRYGTQERQGVGGVRGLQGDERDSGFDRYESAGASYDEDVVLSEPSPSHGGEAGEWHNPPSNWGAPV
eukprot:Hpha_TRINITY_DN15370_c4_g1::TRINITY_DN15370_c4_g1_i1::g.87438::m.87438